MRGFKDEPEPERKLFRKRRGFKLTYFFPSGKNCYKLGHDNLWDVSCLRWMDSG